MKKGCLNWRDGLLDSRARSSPPIDLQEKSMAKLLDIARPRPDQNMKQDLRGSALNAFDLKLLSVLKPVTGIRLFLLEILLTLQP